MEYPRIGSNEQLEALNMIVVAVFVPFFTSKFIIPCSAFDILEYCTPTKYRINAENLYRQSHMAP